MVYTNITGICSLSAGIDPVGLELDRTPPGTRAVRVVTGGSRVRQDRPRAARHL
jgi:hypothetical protein